MNARLHFVAVLAAATLLVACNKTTTSEPPPADPAASPQAAAPTPPAAALAAPPPSEAATPVESATPSITGFKHDAANDVFGYYMPEGEVKFGKWVLSSINVGTPQEFADYESGKRDPPQYAPVMVEIVDVTSPQKENELGGTYYTVQRRVLPAAYSVADGRVEFRGKDEVLGEVSFSGALDVATVKRAAAGDTLTSGENIVLTGKLTVGNEVRDVKFTWFGGD